MCIFFSEICELLFPSCNMLVVVSGCYINCVV